MKKQAYQPRKIETFEDMTRNQRLTMQSTWGQHLRRLKSGEDPDKLDPFEKSSTYNWSHAPELLALIEQELLYFKQRAHLGILGWQGLRFTDKGIALMQTWMAAGRPGEITDDGD